ncbi:Ig-like domain-containing protein [Priestia aryabhattai]|uniref:Ig-like domain-containing protein n=1 Tax=Priestia aryabhattai TaxID=412384 RepID=UPI0035327DF9
MSTKVRNQILGTTVVREDDAFSMAIDRQKVGEKLIVTSTDESGNISEAQEIIVKDVTPPSKPTVNSVTGKADEKARLVLPFLYKKQEQW